jgi:hypothetical protein
MEWSEVGVEWSGMEWSEVGVEWSGLELEWSECVRDNRHILTCRRVLKVILCNAVCGF